MTNTQLYMHIALHTPTPQVRFYAAELILALEHIHAQSIVYRDLKVCQLTVDWKFSVSNEFICVHMYVHIHMNLSKIKKHFFRIILFIMYALCIEKES